MMLPNYTVIKYKKVSIQVLTIASMTNKPNFC